MKEHPRKQVGARDAAGCLRGFAGLLVAAALVGGAAPAGGQGVDCQALRAEIEASGSEASGSGQFAAALRQQQSELARARDYADSIGCDSGFLFDSGPPQCDALTARIERMQESIGQLREQFQAGGADGGGRRRALTEQYNNFCGPGPGGGLGVPAQGPQLLPVDPDAPSPDGASPADAGPSAPRSESKALCVRQCDGGFFPITDQATPDNLEGLSQLCKALCPNAEASLYTTAPSGGIETAVAADGTPYSALPAAFKYQKSFDPTCSCKPPHQSWAQALAGAEKLLEGDKHDVIVTQKMSDAMSRPATPSPATSTAKPARKVKATRKPKPHPTDSIAIPDVAVDEPSPPNVQNPGEDVMRQLRRGAPTF